MNFSFDKFTDFLFLLNGLFLFIIFWIPRLFDQSLLKRKLGKFYNPIKFSGFLFLILGLAQIFWTDSLEVQQEKLLTSIISDDMSSFTNLVSSIKNLNYAAELKVENNTSTFTPLILAVSLKKLEMTKLMLDSGADPNHSLFNEKNKKSTVPLTVASLAGDPINASELIKKGAKLDYANEDGATALFWAAAKGHKDIVKLLLDSGADATIKEKTKGLDARMIADMNGYQEIVDLFDSRKNP